MKITIRQEEYDLIMEYGTAAALEAKRLSDKYHKDFLDCDDLVRITGVGRDNIRALFHNKDFPSKRIGKRQVIEVLAFILWAMKSENC